MEDGKRQGILGHLRELRWRLIKSVIAVVITTTVAFVFRDQIAEILKIPAGDYEFIYIGMTEMIGTFMWMSLICGIIAAMPYLVYHLLMFVSPGLKPKERRAVYIILPWVALMFAGGVIFGYFILVPAATDFLLNFGSEVAASNVRFSNYVSVIARLLLGVGLVFELPVITSFLSRIGVISPQWLASKRKGAVIFAFIAAAIITPTPDPLNQTLVAAPLIALYEMSIWLSKLVYRKKAETAATVPASAS